MERPEIINNAYIAQLLKKKHLADVEYTEALVLKTLQQHQPKGKKKDSKKRPAPAAAAPDAVEKEKKAKKDKPEGWTCEGNVAAKKKCPLAVEDQKYPGGGTRHEKKTYRICKACKKELKTSTKEEAE